MKRSSLSLCSYTATESILKPKPANIAVPNGISIEKAVEREEKRRGKREEGKSNDGRGKNKEKLYRGPYLTALELSPPPPTCRAGSCFS